MSLQLAAQHLASRGRGPDTMLVHMAPSEVRGLQALARAHGGTLTVNPQTGLPEAGFLQSILPTLIGAGLSVASGGTLTPMMAALITGGVTGAATGSLRKGLMAGLGAYGGAGIGSAIGGIGARAIGAGLPAAVAEGATQAMPTALGGADLYADLAGVPTAVTSPVTQSVIQATPLVPTPPAYLQGAVDPYGGFPAAAPSAGRGAYTVDPFGGLDKTVTPQPAQAVAAPARVSEVVAAPAAPAPTPAMTARPEFAADYRNQMDIASDIAAPREAALREAGPMGRFTRGLQEVVKKPSELFKKENMRYGLAALAPMMMEDQKSTQYQGSGANPYRYSYSSGRVANPVRTGDGGEYRFFEPVYTRMAEGGTVQEMSDRNQAETFIANGGQRFADGGEITPPKYVFDPLTNTLKDVTGIQPVRTATRPPAGYRNPLEVSPGPAGDMDNTWGEMSLDEQADFYAENPTLAAITQFGQNVFGYTTPGMIQNYFVPDFVKANKLSAQGLRPSNYGFNQGLGYFSLGNVVPGQLTLAEGTPGIFNAPVGGVGLYANPPGGVPGGLGLNPSNTGLGLTSAGANLANYGYTPSAAVTGVPTISNAAAAQQAAAEYNASLAAAAAQAAAEDPSSAYAVNGSDFGYDVSAGYDAAAAQAAADAVSDAVAASDASSGVSGVDSGSDGGGGVGDSGDGFARGGISALQGAFARGGYNLGDYSDGGRLLRGPGDGVSDSIPATIANKRPARLADGEFVVPARIVSELGNGSTEAGARKLYAMMDRIQKARKKSVGKGKVAVNSRADKLLPA